MKPRVFISTVSSELGSIRQLTANVLERLGYEPVWQDIFGTEPGDLKQMLRDKIDECVGLIQIVGRGYGAEPLEPDPEFGRVSYTQYELLYARRRGRRRGCCSPKTAACTTVLWRRLTCRLTRTTPTRPAFKPTAALQDTWRLRLRRDAHLWHAAANNTELELKLERLKDEFAALRRGFRRWQSLVLGSGVSAVLLLGCVLLAQWWVKRATHKEIQKISEQVAEVQKGQTITAARIRIRLEEASERARDTELAAGRKRAPVRRARVAPRAGGQGA